MVSETNSISNKCYNVFAEPFNQGYYNLHDAFVGTKTQLVAQNTLGAAPVQTPTEHLSLARRVGAFVVGLILVVPLVNMVAFQILRCANSSFIYTKTLANAPAAGNSPAGNSPAGNSPAGNSPAGNPPAGNPPAGNPPADNPPPPRPPGGNPPAPRPEHGRAPRAPRPPAGNPPAPPAPRPPVALRAPAAPRLINGPVSEDQMMRRKADALEHLALIEDMVAGINDPRAAINILSHRFGATRDILEFDLDAVLQRYRSTHRPSKLLDFMDWANVPNEIKANSHGQERLQRDLFIDALTTFENENSPQGMNEQQYNAVRNLFKNLAQYFDVHRARVEAGTPAENALKEQFVRTYLSVIDANNNCIDQTLSQLQTLALEVIAEGDAACQAISPQEKIINRAGLALCQYRTNLLREILIEQNPREHHMADLERVATQRVAAALGMQGNIFGAGANYAWVLENVDDRVNAALEAFLDRYKPEAYLLTELRTYHGEDTQTNHIRNLRSAIQAWAYNYYDLNSEECDEEPQPLDMDHRLSAGRNDDGSFDSNLSFGMMAGNLTPAGIAFLMQSLGLLV